MLNKLIALAALSIILGCFSICSTGQEIPKIAKYFGTKCRYEEVNPHLQDDLLKVMLEPNRQLTNCEAVHITAILRHGTRYPTKKYIKPMNDIHDLVIKNGASTTNDWLENLKTQWRMPYTEEMDGNLVDKGKTDHKKLAVRLSKLFPTLISKYNFENQRFKFITSSKHRCHDSINAFKEALVELWELGERKSPEVGENDALMRFFDVCKDKVKSPTPPKENEVFSTMSEMTQVQEKVAKSLGVPQTQLTPGMVEAAFALCAHEFSIHDRNSPWCNLFNEEDAQVLEYSTDLNQFRKCSIFRESSCSLFLDLFNRLDQVASAASQVTEAVTVQMGHAETLMPLLTLLRFFDGDTDLKASNYASQRNRKFRTSHIMPYAANLVFVLHKCPGGHRLQLLRNEKSVQLPNINEDAPLYSKVKDTYKGLLEECKAHKNEC